MIICKEEFIQLEELASNQSRMYVDSADVGIHASTGVKTTMRRIVKMFDEYLGRKSKWERDSSVKQWKVSYFLPVEEDNGSTVGYNISILFVEGRILPLSYFSIDIRRGLEK